MKISELMKKIREDHGFSFTEMGKRLNFSRGMIDAIEKERSPVSQKILEAYIKNFPTYENNLIESYVNQYLPEEMHGKLKAGDYEVQKIDQLYKVKIYNFISENDGMINFNEFEEIEIPLNTEDKNIILKNGYIFRVLGEYAQPYFYQDDLIVFTKEKFNSWQILDRRLILVKINEKYYLKKVFFDNGEAYLHCFNERLYPKIKIDENIEFIAILYSQIKRHIEKIKF